MTLEQATQKAREIAEGLKKQIDGGADFAKLATENSDDTYSAAQGGDLRWLSQHDLAGFVKPFADAALALKPGQISGVVESRFGFHIIKLEAVRDNLPEDFEKNKAKYTEEVTQQMKEDAWKQYQQQLRDAAKIVVVDPELKAYTILRDDSTGGVAEAAQLLQAAAQADPNNASARYELAQLYEQAGQRDEAIKQLTELSEGEQGASSAQVHLDLGRLLKDAGQKKQALEQFKSASDWAAGTDYSNYFLHSQLKDLFTEMGAKEDAAREQQWLDDFMKQMQEQGGGPGSNVIHVD